MKTMKRRKKITVIRKSCLTGKAIWIYRGTSQDGARLAYWLACKKEVRRVRMWMQQVNKRRNNLGRFIKKCILSQPQTPEQQEAVRYLCELVKKVHPCNRDFYEHIMEERRRRKKDAELRHKMRKNGENMNYDK